MFPKIFPCIALVCLLSVVLSKSVATIQSQELIQWSPQARIPDFEDITESPPFLIADQNFTVHAFNSQPLDLQQVGSPEAVFYRQWVSERGWTEPVDIILNPAGNALNLVAVFKDNQNIVHLLIQMNQTDLYYTKSNLATVGQAATWSPPSLLDNNSVAVTLGIPFVAALSGDDNGNLVALFGGYRDGNGMYAINSADRGDAWSDAQPIYLTEDEQILPVAPRLSIGRSGTIHAVWSSFNDDGSGGPGYYTNLDMASGNWENLKEIDTPGIRTANVIEYGDDIIMVYYQNEINKNWWRRSRDGGQTWSIPALVSSPHKGTNGLTSFVVDSNNILYLFFGQRIDEDNHGMWYTTWTGSSWTEAVAVVRGAQVRDQIGGQGFDPGSANAVIVNGNRLLVTWVSDGIVGLNGAWYAYSVLDVPELPRLPLATPTPVINQTDSTTAPTNAPGPPSPTPFALNTEQLNQNQVTSSPATLLGWSLLPVIVLILFILAVHQYRQRR